MLIELVIEMLGDLVVLRRVRPPEGIKGKAEPSSELFLQGMHLRAVFCDRHPGLVRGQLSRRAVLIRRANEQNLVSAGPMKTSVSIGRKHGAYKIAEMLYTVDIRKR